MCTELWKSQQQNRSKNCQKPWKGSSCFSNRVDWVEDSFWWGSKNTLILMAFRTLNLRLKSYCIKQNPIATALIPVWEKYLHVFIRHWDICCLYSLLCRQHIREMPTTCAEAISGPLSHLAPKLHEIYASITFAWTLHKKRGSRSILHNLSESPGTQAGSVSCAQFLDNFLSQAQFS